MQTYVGLLYDILNSLKRQGFRRILLVNGHGGNSPAQNIISEWMVNNREVSVQLYNWWNAPLTWEKVIATDAVASHASWMENFAWTRLDNVTQPDVRKQMISLAELRKMNPAQARQYLGDGNYGGSYQRPDDDMQAIWDTAVSELRDTIESL
jgi:creatinine amidohydrolase